MSIYYAMFVPSAQIFSKIDEGYALSSIRSGDSAARAKAKRGRNCLAELRESA